MNDFSLLKRYRFEHDRFVVSVIPEYYSENRVNDDTHLLHFIKGRGRAVIDDQEFHLVRGDVLAVPPFRDYFIEVFPDTLTINLHYRLFIGDDVMEDRWRLPFFFQPDYFPWCEESLSRVREMVHEDSATKMLLAPLAHELVVRHLINNELEPTVPERADSRIVKVYKKILNPRYRVFDSRELAATCGLSVSQLNRVFKKYFKTSPQRLWNLRRYREARVALTRTRKPIKVIAHEQGFATTNYFTIWFKRVDGVSPSECRRKGMRAI